jgi:hypothetical protein
MYSLYNIGLTFQNIIYKQHNSLQKTDKKPSYLTKKNVKVIKTFSTFK